MGRERDQSSVGKLFLKGYIVNIFGFVIHMVLLQLLKSGIVTEKQL